MNILQEMKEEIKIVMLGRDDSGKSTLISVLINNRKDNGKGIAARRIHVT